MNFKLQKFCKTALFGAVFLFHLTCFAVDLLSLEGVKEKLTELLVQKKKAQAIQFLINYSKVEQSRISKKDLNELLVNIANQFISKEAQDAFEESQNLTMEDPRQALKLNDQCLSLDAQNLNCLIQKARLLSRLKNTKEMRSTLTEIIDLVPTSLLAKALSSYLNKSEKEIENKSGSKINFESKSEENLLFVISEIDRSFQARNYSRVKDILRVIEKNHSEWPDSVFYAAKLESESAENIKQKIELQSVYEKKCKNISKSLARKYRLDFNLCMRSENEK